MTTSVQPYIFFDGNCKEAVTFYAQVFGAELNVMTFEGAPMDVPPEQAKRVMHATLKFGDAVIFASDGMPNSPIDEGMKAHISIGTDDEATGKRYFEALAEGGSVTMAYEKQFWGDIFGMVIDRFGVKWMVNTTPQS